MQLVRSDGKHIGFTTGRGGLVEGRRTLVFVHGSGGSRLHWNYQRQFFEKSYNVVVVDLPGHGEAGTAPETSVEAYVTHLLHLIRFLPGERFCLFGHSLGGAIVQAFTIFHPNDVEALGLVGTGARLRVLPTILEGLQDRFEETVVLINRYAFSQKSPPDLIQRGIQAMLRTSPEVLLGDLKACDRFDMMDRLGEIQVPTLVVCGRDDSLTPPKYAEFLADRIGEARLEIIDGAGHMVMIERPEEFNRKVLAFLQTLGEGEAYGP